MQVRWVSQIHRFLVLAFIVDSSLAIIIPIYAMDYFSPIILSKTISMLQRRLSLAVFRFSEAYPANANLASTGTTFYAKDLVRELRKDLLPLPDTLPFGKYNSDHMFSVDHSKDKGWGTPAIRPFEHLKMHPFTSALHYGIQCFEGLKAYRNAQGEIRLFRPWCNALRLKKSSTRLTLPDFDGNEFVKIIAQLVKLEERWIPPKSEYSLYVRPLHIATDETLGVSAPTSSRLLIMAGPVGPYYASGFKPISLSSPTDTIRSAPLGTGAYKIGGNYAPTILATSKVAPQHQQVLWLHGNEIMEVGSSNIFFVFKDSSGQLQVATPPLDDLILPGVTRDSILTLLRDEKKYKVSVRKITIDEVVERQKKGEVMECFGAGTAVIVSAVKNIEYKGVNYNIPVDPTLQIGPVSHQIRNKMLDIQEGRSPDRFNWILKVK